MDGLKQRVIGALVVVSLLVIFVPMLFDEPHTERSSRTIEIPEEPPFPEVSPRSDISNQPQSKAPSYRIEEPGEQTPSDAAQPEPENLPGGERAEPGAPQPLAETIDPPASRQPVQASEPEPAATAKEETPPEQEEYSRSLKGSWVVQLGSFGNADNAQRLRNKAREKGYDSHIQEVERGGTTLTRVFSGPFAKKSDAERAKQSLDREFGVQSLVTFID